MTRAAIFRCFVLLMVSAAAAASVRAQGAGQDDLDQATELQLTARSPRDLQKVAELCESAIKKGLDEGNQKFAEQLLSSTLYQQATQLSAAIFEQTPPDPRWPIIRQLALKSLERVVELDPKLGEAHLLIGRLQALPGGDDKRALEAINTAISTFDEDPAKRSEALVYRAQLRDDEAEKIKDYDRAIEADPGNADAWQARALTYLNQGETEKAIADFNTMLEKNGDNAAAHLALAEALTNLEKYDEAKKHIDKAIQLEPESSLGYTLRARLHILNEDTEAALADLDKALKLQPRDISALLIRARVHMFNEDIDAARDDVERALLIAPNLPQAIVLRSILSAEEGNLGDAIADMRRLIEADPDNATWQLQLASFYLQDRRPSKAIDIFTKMLAADETNDVARQARADALLSIGKHAEAIEDFEIAVKQVPEDDSVLNNFAWVLATSPDDELRDGRRAIELAKKAAEVTDYKEAHILSTLAAAYAEVGDWDNAIKWSTKAVELGAASDEIDEQLKNELESYKQKKPWRERQTVDEKEDPLQQRRSGFET